MKKQIWDMLANADDYISGEEISEALGVSRTAVWKHIKKLKEDGFQIESSTKKGYRLLQKEKILIASYIQNRLAADTIGSKIQVFEEIDSTNDEAKREHYQPDGTVFLADVQTKGKGRVGRLWESVKGEGIWMSILLKPEMIPADVSQITLIAGLAVVKGLQEQNAMIKWPNDIVINGKKICGILTEMSAEMERVEYIVCGIGINVNVTAFTDGLKEKATSLYIENHKVYNRNEIIIRVLNEFEILYKIFLQKGFAGVRSEYKRYCINIGREVDVVFQKETLRGKCIDIEEDGSLMVDTQKKGILKVNAGEVSIRGIYGYV